MPGLAVVSPHLDDAVLSAWSALRRGALVVNVFDGVPAAGTLARWDRVTRASDSAERMRERLAEDRAALAVAGAESVSLGLLEAQYRDGEPDTAALDAALDAAVRDRGEVWAPAGIGAHPDHAAVRRWALALAASGGARVRLYAELPYAVRHGWPGWVIGQDEPAYFAHDAWWEAHLPQGVALAPAAHGLDADEVELKLRALAEYRTQLYAVDGGPAGLVTGPATRGFELSWAVGA